MSVTLVLPRSLQEVASDKIMTNAQTMNELLEFLKENLKLSQKLLDENGGLKRNILLILNDAIVPKEQHDELKFSENSTLEIMFQFAGG